MLSRVRTGIEGFDELVLGGFPRGETILLTGRAGTGKSTFGMQFIYKGAKVYDEPGIYVTLEESISSILKNASSYGWDLETLEKKSQIALVDIAPAVGGQIRKIDPTDMFSAISNHWKRIGAKRIVVDPIAILGLQTESPMQLRQDLIRFSSLLKQLDSTVIFVTEIPEDSQSLSRFGVEEFIADGVVVLYYSRMGGTRVRGIEVRKLRGTSHKEGVFPVGIGDSGLVAYPSQKLPKLFS
jgi:KaiC/GvpD/RAD55 family RecA-like ATPase